MMIPVKTFGDYTFCFEAEEETISMRSHFVDECGWTPEQFKRIRNYKWFSARVSLWKDGIELGAEYLGGCCYRTESAFYKKYETDYFADMVRTLAEETKDPELIKIVDRKYKR